jgi:hypothetical protein
MVFMVLARKGRQMYKFFKKTMGFSQQRNKCPSSD